MGLTSYLIYADVPTMAAELIQSLTTSPWVFLLALNLALLVAGCLLDIISAIVVIVPLMLPVAAALESIRFTSESSFSPTWNWAT